MTFDIQWTHSGKLVQDDNTLLDSGVFIQRAEVVPLSFQPIWDSKASVTIASMTPINVSPDAHHVIAALELVIDIEVKDPMFSTKHWECHIFTHGDGTSQKAACSALQE